VKQVLSLTMNFNRSQILMLHAPKFKNTTAGIKLESNENDHIIRISNKCVLSYIEIYSKQATKFLPSSGNTLWICIKTYSLSSCGYSAIAIPPKITGSQRNKRGWAGIVEGAHILVILRVQHVLAARKEKRQKYIGLNHRTAEVGDANGRDKKHKKITV
jgi:hypothetical protein